LRNESALAVQPPRADQPEASSTNDHVGSAVEPPSSAKTTALTAVGVLVGIAIVAVTVAIFAVALSPATAGKWPRRRLGLAPGVISQQPSQQRLVGE
jgi:hypothetical protein